MRNTIQSGKLWLDTEGKPIQAHGGAMFYGNGMYYWYGEKRNLPTVCRTYGRRASSVIPRKTSAIGRTKGISLSRRKTIIRCSIPLNEWILNLFGVNYACNQKLYH